MTHFAHDPNFSGFAFSAFFDRERRTSLISSRFPKLRVLWRVLLLRFPVIPFTQFSPKRRISLKSCEFPELHTLY